MITVIRNAEILSIDIPASSTMTGDIVIRNGLIECCGPAAADGWLERADRVIEAHGRLAMPGLVNGHIHSTSAFMKGAFEGLPLEVYMLYEAPLDALSHSPRLYYLRAMLTAIDMLKQGVVALRDDAHFFGDPTVEGADAIFEAYRDSGMRASVGFGIPNVVEHSKIPRLRDFLSDEQAASMDAAELPSAAQIRYFYDTMFERWHRQEGGRLLVHASCSTPHRVDMETYRALVDMALRHDVSFDVHMLETKTQNVHAMEREGKSLVRYLYDAGLLTEHTISIHSVWADEDDLDLIAKAGAVIAHNPISNLKLGSGVMPLRSVLERGIPVCIGTDEASVDEANNLWFNAKLASLLPKISSFRFRDWPVAGHLLQALTAGGARAMRRQEMAGCLAAGRDADIILVDTRSSAFIPRNDLNRQLVGAENGSSVSHVFVAGDLVMEDGVLTRVDEQAIYDEVEALWPQYASLRDTANSDADALAPAYEKSYAYSAARETGLGRVLPASRPQGRR